MCDEIFSKIILKALVNEAAIWIYDYGGLNIPAKRVVYIHGSVDPWNVPKSDSHPKMTTTEESDTPTIFIREKTDEENLHLILRHLRPAYIVKESQLGLETSVFIQGTCADQDYCFSCCIAQLSTVTYYSTRVGCYLTESLFDRGEDKVLRLQLTGGKSSYNFSNRVIKVLSNSNECAMANTSRELELPGSPHIVNEQKEGDGDSEGVTTATHPP